MPAIDLQAVISLPPHAVSDALCDLARRPALDPTITELTPPQGELRAGSAFSGRGSMVGTDSDFEGVVTAMEPDAYVGLAFMLANGAHLEERWRLSPTASGTLVHYHAELRLPGGLFGRLLDRLLVAGGFHKQREAVLRHVKAALEHPEAAAP